MCSIGSDGDFSSVMTTLEKNNAKGGIFITSWIINITIKELEFSLFWVTRYFLVTFAILSNALLFRYFFSRKAFVTFFVTFSLLWYFLVTNSKSQGGQEHKNIPKFTSKNRKIAIYCMFLSIISKSLTLIHHTYSSSKF